MWTCPELGTGLCSKVTRVTWSPISASTNFIPSHVAIYLTTRRDPRKSGLLPWAASNNSGSMPVRQTSKHRATWIIAGTVIEQMLLGLVAYRVGEKVQYDCEHGRVTNSDKANALLSKEYRKGWPLDAEGVVSRFIRVDGKSGPDGLAKRIPSEGARERSKLEQRPRCNGPPARRASSRAPST